MQVHFERSGGFAGLRISLDVDSANLPPEEASELSKLIETAHFFELPAVLRAIQPGADRFQYRLKVKTESQEHSVELDEAATPEGLRPLLNWLMAAKRKR